MCLYVLLSKYLYISVCYTRFFVDVDVDVDVVVVVVWFSM